VLGIVQGLGEFLPISSSGHLIVVPWLLGWPDHGLSFDVALHLGTLLAVAVAFGGDWVRLGLAGLRAIGRGRPFDDPDARTLWLLGAASVPAAVAGVLLDDWAETVFRNPLLVAVTMASLGAVLFAADRRSQAGKAGPVSARDALLVGLAQAAAIVPGVSRSGSTISMALFLGYARPEAARFSFLLALPVTLGAALVKVPKLLQAGGDLTPLAIGLVAAGITGFLAIRGLLTLVKTRDYRPFVYYRWGFAALIVAVALVRSALLR
jgi:undecaprenyl-diphosphatase